MRPATLAAIDDVEDQEGDAMESVMERYKERVAPAQRQIQELSAHNRTHQ